MAGPEQFFQVCVVYIQRTGPTGRRQVLLGRKKTGLGLGHYVAPGGKLEGDESPIDAAVREVREEVGLRVEPGDLHLIGDLDYPFPHDMKWSQKSWVFLTEDPGGTPAESLELAPTWIDRDHLPLSEMWDDAKYWLPEALNGKFVSARFAFGPDGRTVESSSHPNFTG